MPAHEAQPPVGPLSRRPEQPDEEFPRETEAAWRRGAGHVRAVITEWTVATPGARPHDPAVAPDGAVWYTGQANGTLGRLDPATGQAKEFPLKKPQTKTFLPYGVGPHGLIAD